MNEPTLVNQLLKKIHDLADVHGMELHRYQTNTNGSFGVCITYALHTRGEPRPVYSRDCIGPSVELNQREGSTERCEAYRKLSLLEKEMQ